MLMKVKNVSDFEVLQAEENGPEEFRKKAGVGFLNETFGKKSGKLKFQRIFWGKLRF